MIERYTRPRMGSLWTMEKKFQRWLDVEIFACEAWAELGVIPRESVEEIRQKAKFEVGRILEIEETVQHDVVAFTTNVAEYVGPAAKYVHYGLTSSDVVDTALASLMTEAADIVREGLEKLSVAVREKAVKYSGTVCMGRTHGVHAEPTTFGLKFALWWQEIERHIKRWAAARETIAVGKISGAVGTFANAEPFVEEYVCRKLGLKPAPVSTQILQRDRHAEYLTVLALIASSLDKFATEIRHLQKTETREAEEPFKQGQKGSSSMPHKRNPRLCEQVSGLARVVRGNALAAMENVALWHERDISHSSSERVIIADSTILVDYLLHTFTRVVEGLHVYPENMLRNLNRTGGLIFSQRVLLKLVQKGLTREEAYGIVQNNAMKAWSLEPGSTGEMGRGITFRELITAEPRVRDLLTAEELEDCFDYRHHLKHVPTVFKRLGLS